MKWSIITKNIESSFFHKVLWKCDMFEAEQFFPYLPANSVHNLLIHSVLLGIKGGSNNIISS